MQRKYDEFYGQTAREIEKIKVALYLRLSRDDGDKSESNSITSQREILTDYVKKYPEFEIHGIYVDDGYSGTNFNRPDFIRMMDDVYEGEIQCVIVKDLSRLGRNYSETSRFIDDVFPRLNVRFIAINNGIDTASNAMNAATQCISVGVTNVINESLAATTSVNVRGTLDHNRQQGKFIGSFACYGYMKDPTDHHKLIIDPETAPIVQSIYKGFISGEGILSIVRRLNEFNVPNPSTYKAMKNPTYKYKGGGSLWTDRTIRRILQNEMYIGNMVQGKCEKISYKIKQTREVPKEDWIIVKGTHEAIISENDFYKAQSLFKKKIRMSPKKSTVDLFSGFVRCAECGYTLAKKSNNHSYGAYEYYRCVSKSKMGKTACKGTHTIRIDKLEKAVLVTLQTMIKTAIDMDEFVKKINPLKANKADETLLERKIRKESAKLEKYKTAMVDLYPDYKCGLITQDDYLMLKASMTEKIQNLEKSLAIMDEQYQKCKNGVVQENEFVENFKKYGEIQKLTRPMLVELLDTITVHENGEITIRWNFTDAYQEALDRIEQIKSTEKTA